MRTVYDAVTEKGQNVDTSLHWISITENALLRGRETAQYLRAKIEQSAMPKTTQGDPMTQDKGCPLILRYAAEVGRVSPRSSLGARPRERERGFVT